MIPNVMKFIVTNQNGHTTPLPATLRPVTAIPENQSAVSRDLVLRKMPGPCNTGQMWAINDLTFEDIVEYPRLDTTEIWSFINQSGVTHPMHMHLVQFLILDRQPFDIIGGVVTSVKLAGWAEASAANPRRIARPSRAAKGAGDAACRMAAPRWKGPAAALDRRID